MSHLIIQMMNVPLRLSYEKQEMMHVCFITVERERENLNSHSYVGVYSKVQGRWLS